MGAFSSAFVARLDRVPIRGTFEAHLTVDTDRRGDFEASCAELGVAHVGIELPAGAHRAQPMTASYHRGELAAVVAEIDALHAALVARGFAIVRVKLEALASNDGVPATDGEHDGYFEFHVKVRVAAAELAQLAAIAGAHGARLSRNDRRRDADGAQRFVTLRCYHLGRATADAKLDALVAALSAFELAGIAREFTVYDSRIELDAGWLEPPARERSEHPDRRAHREAIDGARPVTGARRGRADVRHHLMAGVIERIARSPARDAFVLRGGMLTRAWVGTRPARDLDFVGDFAFDLDDTRRRFAHALEVEVADNIVLGLQLATPIWTDTAFPGVRLELAVHYSGVDQTISIDVGFNDPLVPAPVMLAFAGTTGTVDVRAVRPETQLAWKLHALAEMGTSWRPKDLHDAWLITTKLDLDAAALVPAIVAAFESRDYARASAIGVFDAPHWATKTSRLRWERPQPLADVVAAVRARLAPTFAALPEWKGTR